jgi:hypothetical protein
VNFYSNTQEAFKTTISGLTVGKTYILKAYYAKFASTPALGRITVKLGTTVIDQYTPTLGCGWETRFITFTATATSHDLQFQNTGIASPMQNASVSISADPLYEVCDTDNDGLSNQFDLDSDGDGCTDAKEGNVPGTLRSGDVKNGANGGVVTTTTNTPGAIAGALNTYGANGLADELETVAESGILKFISSYSNYALSANLNTCTGVDTDGDGVSDLTDIDDDNDGILDITECNASPSKILFAGSSEDFSTMRSSLFAEFDNNKASGATIVQSNIIENATVPAGFYDGYDMVVFGGAAFNAIHPNHWAALTTAIQNKTSKSFVIQSDNCCVAGNQIGLVNLLNTVFGTNYSLSSSNAATTEVFPLNNSNSYANVISTNSLTGNNYLPMLNVAVSDILFYSPTVSGSALAGMKQLPGTTDRNRFVAWFVDGTITQGAPWYPSNQNKIAKAFYDAFSATAPSCDIDNDGILNQLDLDSDGDGCPDATESGVSGTLNSGSVKNGISGAVTSTNTIAGAIAAGSYGSNGLANGVETVADNGVINYINNYSLYALNNSFTVCADTDGDGIKDVSDIDDDNDGVLDATESPFCFYSSGEWLSGVRPSIRVSTPLSVNASYNRPNDLVDGDNGTGAASYAVIFNATSTAARPVYSFTMPMPVELKTIYLGYINANTHFNANTVLRLEASNDNTNWTTLGNGYNFVTAVPGLVGTINANTFTVTQNSGKYLHYRIYWVSGGGINNTGYANEVYFETLPTYQA